jgi:hypothetical protein
LLEVERGEEGRGGERRGEEGGGQWRVWGQEKGCRLGEGEEREVIVYQE